MKKRLIVGLMIVVATMMALSGGDENLTHIVISVGAVVMAIGAGVSLAPTMLNSDEPTDTPFT